MMPTEPSSKATNKNAVSAQAEVHCDIQMEMPWKHMTLFTNVTTSHMTAAETSCRAGNGVYRYAHAAGTARDPCNSLHTFEF